MRFLSLVWTFQCCVLCLCHARLGSCNSIGCCRGPTCWPTMKPSSSKAVMMCSSSARLPRRSSWKSWPWLAWPPSRCMCVGCRRLFETGRRTLPFSASPWLMSLSGGSRCSKWKGLARAGQLVGTERLWATASLVLPVRERIGHVLPRCTVVVREVPALRRLLSRQTHTTGKNSPPWTPTGSAQTLMGTALLPLHLETRRSRTARLSCQQALLVLLHLRSPLRPSPRRHCQPGQEGSWTRRQPGPWWRA